jgi:AraC-like DNA-binding protein
MQAAINPIVARTDNQDGRARMITLMLLLSNARLSHLSPDMAALVVAGKLKQAVAHGREAFERNKRQPSPERDVLVGRVTVRSLLAMGREEEAEELMRQMLKTYDSLPRKSIRCSMAIDQATFTLHLNKPARAAQMLVELADDAALPADARVEVLVLLGAAYLWMGRHTDAFHSLELANNMVAEFALHSIADVIALARLHLEVNVWLRSLDELNDHGHCSANDSVLKRLRPVADLDRLLLELSEKLGPTSVGAKHAAQMRAKLRAGMGLAGATQALLSEAALIDAGEMLGVAPKFRVDAAFACLAARSVKAAAELLNTLIYDEKKLTRHRFSGELTYCASKLHMHNGRHSDALRLYKLYSSTVLGTLRFEAATARAPRCLAVDLTKSTIDSAESRLPARYRRAYRYLIEHLDQAELSVRQIAAQIAVTERALQLAFHKHLGMTPAEVIRDSRMKRIHADLISAGSKDSVLAVAMRWGVTNRSTLAQSYRASYSETPSETRHTMVADSLPH